MIPRTIQFAVTIAAVLLSLPAHAQDIAKRPLEHKDYDVWNTISSSGISNDGKWAMYLVQNGAIDGEATLHLQNTKTGSEYVIPRGSSVRFTHDSRFALYRITPEKAKLKKLREQKTSSSDLPKTKLQILELESGAIVNVPAIRSFKIPEENGAWVACQIEAPSDTKDLSDDKSDHREVYVVTPGGLQRPAKKLKLKSREQLAQERGESQPEPKKEEAESKEKKKKGTSEKSADAKSKNEKKKSSGTPLVLINLESGIQRTFPFVDSFGFSKNGKILAFVTSVKADEGDNTDPNQPKDGLSVVQLDNMNLRTVSDGAGEYKNLSIHDDGSALAFITNKDDYDKENPTWAVYHWSAGGKFKPAKKIAVEGDRGIPEGWWVSPNSSQQFSDDGRRLFFETAPVPEKVAKHRKAESEGRKLDQDDSKEQAKLDIWHWQDPQLQPEQLLQAELERRRDYRAVYDLKSKKIAQLADRQMPFIALDYRSPANVAVANTNIRYRKTLSWDVPGRQDAYLVNLSTGERSLVLEAVKWDVRLSPEGKYLTWFDAEQKAWFAKSAKKIDQDPIEISKGIKFPLYDELNDRPMLPRSYGSPGWLAGDRAILIYDRNDIWQLDPTGADAPVCITNGFGRQSDLRFRYLRLDREERTVDPSKPLMLSAFDYKTKASGFYVLDPIPTKTKKKAAAENKDGAARSLRRLIVLNEQVSGLQKAENSDRVLFTRSTFRQFPDLWSSDIRFKEISRISDVNPQQEQYSWGDAELVNWKSTKGQDLDGILLKPDGFDPTKQYPMMVYFYERNSDNLHRYYTPAAGRSIICHSFYVSRGYLVFIPDIPYRTGEPGPSAADSIIPGVKNLIAQGFVDEKRIGMQGHSWGGYQTAYLVTQTDLFACAESGAPVSNMTSAYGGIRWGSGLSRMFQYERTQSRIGDDLWNGRDKYIANSPLFFADKINTPLLILHNDEDGAVPWYQGIELFVALRRLEKPAWMLNYNGNPHWVMGDYNRRDFAIRMQQFFDHYLLDAPEPEWMAVGVPAVNKGKKFGLDLLEPKAAEKKD